MVHDMDALIKCQNCLVNVRAIYNTLILYGVQKDEVLCETCFAKIAANLPSDNSLQVTWTSYGPKDTEAN